MGSTKDTKKLMPISCFFGFFGDLRFWAGFSGNRSDTLGAAKKNEKKVPKLPKITFPLKLSRNPKSEPKVSNGLGHQRDSRDTPLA